MTAGFLFFTFGLALVVSALKDQSVAEIFQGVIGSDKPFGTGKDYPTSSLTGQPIQQDKENDPGLLAYLQGVAHDQFGLTITEPIGQDSGSHVANSLHKSGRAFDASGTAAQMKAYTDWVSKNFGHSLTELIHNPGGSIKNGKPVPPSFWSTLWAKHKNHVHTGI
jgi:hypothetical protein